MNRIEASILALGPQYLNNRREDLLRLQAALKVGQFAEMVRIGHRIKGSAKVYGFEELGKIAGTLEEAGKRADPQAVHVALERMQIYLDQIPVQTIAKQD